MFGANGASCGVSLLGNTGHAVHVGGDANEDRVRAGGTEPAALM